MTASVFSQLEAVLEHLPFPLEATDRVNEAFQEWCVDQSEEAKYAVELWTYCFVLRYFLIKSVLGKIETVSDVDALVDRAYKRIERNQSTIEDSTRYAHWVSVICRNTFLNHTRKHRPERSIHGEAAPTLVAESPRSHHDMGFALQAFEAAIGRLPAHLQEVTRLHFLEGYTYEEISEELGKPVPTIRSYKHRAIRRLREDRWLHAFFEGTSDGEPD